MAPLFHQYIFPSLELQQAETFQEDDQEVAES
jgi:hypothetical protein